MAILLKNPASQGQAGFGKLRHRSRLPQLRPRRGQPLQQVIAKVKRSMGRLIDLYSEGLLDKSEVEPRLRAAQERLQTLEAEEQSLAHQASQQAELFPLGGRGLTRAGWLCPAKLAAAIKLIRLEDNLATSTWLLT